MNDLFTKLSDLKNTAYKKAFTYSNQVKNQKIKNLIGVNPLNKEWIEEAKHKIKMSANHQGAVKIKYILSSLEKLYYCDWILKNSQFSDNEVFLLIEKAETIYLNICLNFIESHIHDSYKIHQSFKHLQIAIDVLNEANPVMSNKYKQIINRHYSVNSTINHINEICEISNTKFTKSDAVKIIKLISINDSIFKMYPDLKEQVADIINVKLDSLYIDYMTKIKNLKNNLSYSVTDLLSLYDFLCEIIDTFSAIINSTKFNNLFDEHKELKKINEVLNVNYKNWLTVYRYYSLPRSTTNQEQILDVIRDISKNSHGLNNKIIEVQNLSPTPDQIQTFLEQIIGKSDKQEILYYYKIENDLVNAKDCEQKLDEIIRFIKHIDDKLSAFRLELSKNNNSIIIELTRMREEFQRIMDNSIEKQTQDFLNNNKDIRKIKDFFDMILNKLLILDDLNRISNWQNIKKDVIFAYQEANDLHNSIISNYDYYEKIPESSSKQVLRDKIKKQIEYLDKAIPTMILFKLQNTEIYIDSIKKISEKLSMKNHPDSTDKNKLIIIDRFTMRNIVIFNSNFITIGRNENKCDIVLKSNWVSSEHCVIDFTKKKVTDKSSTNGTYINKIHKEIEEYAIDSIEILNIAEAFEFKIDRYDGFYIFKVVKVFDSDLLKNEIEYIQGLFNTDFIWLEDNSSFAVDVYNNQIKSIGSNSVVDQMHDIIILKNANLIGNQEFTIIDSINSETHSNFSNECKTISDRFSVYLF